ncbi:hypothetical protein G9A89_014715 [Geosiphon pyriformis]|nr:hypothetical protein G9A89_014715 [Geosiphon pyriformis]
MSLKKGNNINLKGIENVVKRSGPIKITTSKVEFLNKSVISFLRRMAQVANFAYCLPQNEIGKTLQTEDIPDGGHTPFVYFRGPSLSKKEWFERQLKVTEIDMSPDLHQKSLVDSIWLSHVQQMVPFLINKLRKYVFRPVPIYFVGHGVGGAYATLAAIYFKYMTHAGILKQDNLFKRTQVNLVTFGAPRIGNYAFVRTVRNNLPTRGAYRVTRHNDWLSRDFSPKGQFLHYERELWLDYEPNDCECPPFQRKETLFQCIGRNSRGEIDENSECNLGTVDSENEEDDYGFTNRGPYFGITFGDCNGINPAILNK